MEIIQGKNGTRFCGAKYIEGRNGIRDFYYLGIGTLGIYLSEEWKVGENEFFVPCSYFLVVREFLYCGKRQLFSHDDFHNKFQQIKMYYNTLDEAVDELSNDIKNISLKHVDYRGTSFYDEKVKINLGGQYPNNNNVTFAIVYIEDIDAMYDLTINDEVTKEKY